ncbi:UDP-N-acetylmuramoylalanine-D-glutamate ligase [[Clostridium] cellulosi]|uniref:UDP-N-acetylmuramoylalanine--D-glutamate ligase n=1 Tax=[Clostridium] cellulosi TaxID=29343 RepID=A0A078KUQ6_9FIRM|nr:UDP-N-acetylmuramoylalanine-D-glutamate ligase [[Clostridium] cellulosi]
MNDRLNTFYETIKGRRISMLGIGVSNTPIAKIFAAKGAIVTAHDKRTREKLGKTADELEAAGVKLCLGEDYLKDLDADIIFRTPGMKFYLPELVAARERGAVVTSEMEVFFDLCPCKIIAVTGSDGKTTTTTIISKMLEKQGYKVFLGGNIGRALLPEVENMGKDDFAVVELSSFQLISMRRSPDIAVITNMSPNHLDMHKDMDEYINAKKNIILHQNAFGRAVLNLDNDITRSMVPDTRGACLMFSRKQKVNFGSFLDGDKLCYADKSGVYEVMKTSDIFIDGMHNVENYLAAISAVWGLVDIENMKEVARTFKGVEHRREFVRELDGVKYYNDSIATTPSRTMAGLEAYNQKVILIAGGYDKKIPFDVMGPTVVRKVKTLILIGATAKKIEESVKKAPEYREGNPQIIHAASLEEAVNIARRVSQKGDIVTLSPACASFDMFKNFETRGEVFKDIVNSLK